VYKNIGHAVEELEFCECSNLIHTVLANSEFQAVKDEIEEKVIDMCLVSQYEHVPEMEGSKKENWLTKEKEVLCKLCLIQRSKIICRDVNTVCCLLTE
jgi:hypothetical protein